MKYVNPRFIKINHIAIIIISYLVIISCSKEVFTGIIEPPLEKMSKIIIQTKPAGVAIYLDGKNMGIFTTDSLVWLKSGQHTVTLKLDLFTDKNQSYLIHEGDRLVYSYNYFTDPGNVGSIYCSATPSGADIYLNDSLTNKKTNATLTNIFPGIYKIKVAKNGFRSDSSTVKVYEDATQKINFYLEDTTKGVSYKTTNSPIKSNNISKIVVDKNDIKWIGSSDNGLGRFDGISWKWYTQNNSPLISNYITSLAVDQNNNLWVGFSGGLMMFDGTTWINYTPHIPSQSAVNSIAIGTNNVIWFGTQNGLVCYNGAEWKTFTTLNSGISDNFVMSVSLDNQNRVWLGTAFSGICMFDGTTWKVYNMNNMGLSVKVGDYIQAIAVDNYNSVWVAHTSDFSRGFTGGITVYDGKNWSVIQVKFLPLSLTNVIWIDKDNYKWFGTSQGLIKFMDTVLFKIFDITNSPLSAVPIGTVIVDLKGDLYVGTRGIGVVKIKNGNY